MTRLWLLTAVLLALALVGCGPDCDAYCAKLDQCASELHDPQTFDVAQCLRDCNSVGSDKIHVVRCVIDTSCTDLAGGHCTPTGQVSRFP